MRGFIDKILSRFLILTFLAFFSFLSALDSNLSPENALNNISSSDDDFSVWQSRCKKKDYVSCYLAGRAYLSGYQVLKDYSKAENLLNLACKNNVVESCMVLSEPPREARSLMNNACEKGDARSCKSLSLELLRAFSLSPQELSVKDRKVAYRVLSRNCELDSKGHKDSEDSRKECVGLNEFMEALIGKKDLTLFLRKEGNTKEKYQAGLYFSEILDLCNKAQKDEGNSIFYAMCGVIGDIYADGFNPATLKNLSKDEFRAKFTKDLIKDPKNAKDEILEIQKDKKKAQFYYALGCKAKEQYCKDEILDSILNP